MGSGCRPMSLFSKMRPLSAAPRAWVLAVLVVAAPGLAAAEGGDAARLDRCKTAHAGCVAACQSLESEDSARAGCSARCAADRGVCEAGKGLDSLAEQSARVKGFLDGLTGKDGTADPALPPGPSAAECDAAQDLCSAGCGKAHAGDEAALAGCSSRCMADTAICKAEAGLRAAAPKAKAEVNRWTRFLEGFLDRKGGDGAPLGPAPGESDPDPDPRLDKSLDI
ncbi:hypothetical protein CKO38_01900 [Rhodospirillum rubrum]|nr:hypothetical protein [Rhodospirillum rubrum]MBK1675451.1 hypothetical protein [Rhodospirillum rubrum]